MRQVQTSLLLILWIYVGLTSCNNNHDRPKPESSIQFSFTNSSDAETRPENLEIANVLLSIKDSNGELVVENEILTLTRFGEAYVSEKITLEVGNYLLTEFIILDTEGSALYACPIEGSEKADLVNQPLPLPFTVSSESTTRVTPEVIPIEPTDSPADFGYAEFSFVIVDPTPNSLKIQVFEKINDNDSIPLDAAFMDVYAYGYHTNHSLLGEVNLIPVEDFIFINIKVHKDGYSSYIKSSIHAPSFYTDTLFVTLEPHYPVHFQIDLGEFNSPDSGFFFLSTPDKSYFAEAAIWEIDGTLATVTSYLPSESIDNYEIIAFFFSDEDDEAAFSLGEKVNYGTTTTSLQPNQTYDLNEGGMELEWTTHTGTMEFYGYVSDVFIVAANNPICDHFYTTFILSDLDYLYNDIYTLDSYGSPLANITFHEKIDASSGYYFSLDERGYSEEEFCNTELSVSLNSLCLSTSFDRNSVFSYYWSYQNSEQSASGFDSERFHNQRKSDVISRSKSQRTLRF